MIKSKYSLEEGDSLLGKIAADPRLAGCDPTERPVSLMRRPNEQAAHWSASAS